MGQVPALVIDGHTLADSVSLLFEITYNIIVLTFNITVPCKQLEVSILSCMAFSVKEVSALLVSHAVEKLWERLHNAKSHAREKPLLAG